MVRNGNDEMDLMGFTPRDQQERGRAMRSEIGSNFRLIAGRSMRLASLIQARGEKMLNLKRFTSLFARSDSELEKSSLGAIS